MPTDIKVPSVGESITEGTLVRWLKKEGDLVKAGEPVFELETEKASTDVPAPSAGVLHIAVPGGKTVAIGTTVGTLDPTGSASAKPTRPSSPPALSEKPADGEHFLPPAARRQAAQQKADAAQAAPTDQASPLPREDGQKQLDSKPPPPPPTTGQETRQPMSAIRARIAERLLASQKSTASLTTFNEVDMSAVIELRARYKELFKEKHDVGLGFMSFFVKASVEALKAYPIVNARIDGNDIVYQAGQDIGVAVSTDKGLMVPVLHDADPMSFADIEKTIADLAARAKAGKIAVADLQGGTFTITNGGVFGSLLSTPILNPPQCAILGMHAIQKRAVVRDDQVVIRSMMYLALTYDHRLVDGRDAVLFLGRIKECIENPERMLLEV